jgi:hypothetical protein
MNPVETPDLKDEPVHQLKRIFEITNTERLLLARAFGAVCSARAALWLQESNAGIGTRAAARRSGRPEQYAWAVRIASSYVPKATCLTQAVALQTLLAGAGYESRIEIGVAKEAGNFQAHAWLVCEDQILIGGTNIDQYSHLTTLRLVGEEAGPLNIKTDAGAFR